jgi:hypothetical protein
MSGHFSDGPSGRHLELSAIHSAVTFSVPYVELTAELEFVRAA